MSRDTRLIDLAHEGPFRFGGLEIRPSTREVIVGASRKTLQPRIMQVMVALARSRGEVVSRDDLVRACWNGRTVGDDAINRCIAGLRHLAAAHGTFTIDTIPRVGYRLNTQAPATPSRERTTQPVLAVLPFDSLSNDTGLRFFSDGISEEILGALARISDLRVIGSTSSFAFRGARKAEAAAVLGATHVLDGSVRRGGTRIRVTVQLNEATGGQVLWRKSYDRELADILELQDEVASIVHGELAAHFAPPVQQRQVAPPAYDLYLEARGLSKTSDRWARQKTIECLEGALAIEPNFTRARAMLALALCNEIVDATSYAHAGQPQVFDRACARVRAEAERALAADSDEAEARFALLSLEPVAGNWRSMDAAIGAALARTPSAPLLRDARARACLAVGRMREGFAISAEAYHDDPLSPRRLVEEAARQYNVAGDRVAARLLYEKAAALAGGDDYVKRMRSAFLTAIGDFDAVERLHRDDAGPAHHGLFRDHLVQARRPAADARDFIRQSDAVMRASPFAAFSLFFALTTCGQDGAAIDLVEEAMTIHAANKLWTVWNIESVGTPGSTVFFIPSSARARAHPRFMPLCAKAGLCGYWAETGRWPDFIVDAPNRPALEAEAKALS